LPVTKPKTNETTATTTTQTTWIYESINT
jgi:hypothetical protein